MKLHQLGQEAEMAGNLFVLHIKMIGKRSSKNTKATSDKAAFANIIKKFLSDIKVTRHPHLHAVEFQNCFQIVVITVIIAQFLLH